MEWGSPLWARSSLLVLLLGGCDLAFGVDGDPGPCDLGTFNSARANDLTPANAFSIDWDQTYAVVALDNGTSAELTLPAGELRMIDLGLYSGVTMSLDPEGNALLFTASIEPLTLEGALRQGPGAWKLGARAPRATFVGTPSADVFGPRRMLARMHATDDTVQELEDQNGTWVAIGDAHPLVSTYPPNLTPNGLTAVFARSTVTDTSTTSEIYGMTRPTTDAWFGEPVKILANGLDDKPQLLGNCSRLYTVHAGGNDAQLRRYDR